MKKQYQKPQIVIDLLQSEPLMALSASGRTVTFDTPETNGDASGAASRHTDVWEEDNDEDF